MQGMRPRDSLAEVLCSTPHVTRPFVCTFLTNHGSCSDDVTRPWRACAQEFNSHAPLHEPGAVVVSVRVIVHSLPRDHSHRGVRRNEGKKKIEERKEKKKQLKKDC